MQSASLPPSRDASAENLRALIGTPPVGVRTRFLRDSLLVGVGVAVTGLASYVFLIMAAQFVGPDRVRRSGRVVVDGVRRFQRIHPF